MLKIHTFAPMKMIPCKFHGWVFSNDVYMELLQYMKCNVSYVDMHECYVKYA